MSIQFDFSNLPCKIKPECERYLYMLYNADSRLEHPDEIRMFPTGFTGQEYECFFIIFHLLDHKTVRINGITGVTYTENKPSVWALATSLFSEHAELGFHINERGMPLKELIAYWQCFVVNDLRVNSALIANYLPTYNFDDALDDIMLNWKSKCFGLTHMETPHIETGMTSRLT